MTTLTMMMMYVCEKEVCLSCAGCECERRGTRIRKKERERWDFERIREGNKSERKIITNIWASFLARFCYFRYYFRVSWFVAFRSGVVMDRKLVVSSCHWINSVALGDCVGFRLLSNLSNAETCYRFLVSLGMLTPMGWRSTWSNLVNWRIVLLWRYRLFFLLFNCFMFPASYCHGCLWIPNWRIVLLWRYRLIGLCSLVVIAMVAYGFHHLEFSGVCFYICRSRC